MQTRLIRSTDLADTKLIVENDASQVKIEVNVVFRGTVLPVERKPLSPRTSDLFGVEFDAPILAHDEHRGAVGDVSVSHSACAA